LIIYLGANQDAWAVSEQFGAKQRAGSPAVGIF
jgi:hypothetical protein